MGAGKLVCAFPGQGVQEPGMAVSLRNTPFWRLFEKANTVLGCDLGKICLEGPPELLNDTAFAQPAIFVTSLALWSAAQKNYRPDFLVGHSLGQITALAAAGAFSFEDGLRLVAARGRCMADYAPAQAGMLAVLGLNSEIVKELCEQVQPAGSVSVANENSPQQIVASGYDCGLEELERLALQRGAKRAVRLNVSGPFHSPLMAKAAQVFAQEAAGLEIAECAVPVINSSGSALLQTPQEIRAELIGQLTAPVLFTASVRNLYARGVRRFVEISHRPLLISLARRTERNLQFSLSTEGGI